MQTTERLTWRQDAPEPADVYTAECGRYEFQIRNMPNMGYLLRMWEIRPEDSPILFWEMDGYSLQEAQARAERLADQHVPVIVKGQR
jgi:hypothetical protein